MRRGSVCEQYQRSRRKDGTVTRRGPYAMYTLKRKGKTVGKRLAKKDLPLYRAQIERFRGYEKLAREFLEVSEQLADIEVAPGDGAKKNSSKRSGPSNTPRVCAS